MPSYVIVAGRTVVVPCLTRVTVVADTLEALSASLKVAVGLTATGCPVEPSAGVTAVTVGGVVSAGPPQVSLASAQSPWS